MLSRIQVSIPGDHFHFHNICKISFLQTGWSWEGCLRREVLGSGGANCLCKYLIIKSSSSKIQCHTIVTFLSDMPFSEKGCDETLVNAIPFGHAERKADGAVFSFRWLISSMIFNYSTSVPFLISWKWFARFAGASRAPWKAGDRRGLPSPPGLWAAWGWEKD